MAGETRHKSPRIVALIELTGLQKRYLRGLAHDLEPIVHVGLKGLSGPLLKQLGAALDAHELIKVRLNRHAPLELKEASEEIADEADAAVVQIIGHVIVLYRPAEAEEDRRIVLPRAKKRSTPRRRPASERRRSGRARRRDPSSG